MRLAYVCVILFLLSCSTQRSTTGTLLFATDEKKQRIELWHKGQLLTAYVYPDTIMKPFLFPVNTTDGITMTRGYPIDPKPGERTDHPHHTGVWLNYESVNGLDFWNNSTAIAPARRHLYGTIRHEAVRTQNVAGNKAYLGVTANWHRPDGYILLKEETAYAFTVEGNDFFIDRTTTLKAQDTTVVFKDIKDGFFAIRVARELEMPSQQKDVFVDAHGNKTDVPKMNNEGVTGNYLSSEGIQGDAVWGTRGRWVMLSGKKQNKDVSLVIFDHPSNPGYPSYWHARGYGLFAINPLGQKIFSNGKEELNLTLRPRESVSFTYRLLVRTGAPLTGSQVNDYANRFAGK